MILTYKKISDIYNEEAAIAIKRLLTEYDDRYKDEDRLFQGQRGPLTVKTVTQLVKKWCGDINLKGNFGSHTMKKTWGVHKRTKVGTRALF